LEMSPMDGRYVTHIHHVSHLRNMRETCVMPCANLAKRARNMCEKHLANRAIRGTSAIP
jgi:hypothetical protein